MKKSNVIVFLILAICSVFLLWLWFALGFSKVDSPLDLVLSIIWWIIIVVAVIAIVRIEKARRQRIRTIFVSSNQVFNSEVGVIPYEGVDQLMMTMENILSSLQYGFEKKDYPDEGTFLAKYFVRTDSYSDNNWDGDVVDVKTKEEKEFESKAGLYRIVNSL